MEGIPGQILSLSAGAAFFTRSAVDAIRMVGEISLWIVLALVFVIGQITAFLLFLVLAPEGFTWGQLTVQAVATVILAGLVASFGAIASNSLSSKAKATDPPAKDQAPAQASV